MVERTIAPTDTKWILLQTVVDAVDEVDDAFLVETDGSPRAAVISFERYRQLRDLEKGERRQRAQELIAQIEAEYDGQNDDLTDEQIEQLADRFSREFVDDLVREGKISFEDDPNP